MGGWRRWIAEHIVLDWKFVTIWHFWASAAFMDYSFIIPWSLVNVFLKEVSVFFCVISLVLIGELFLFRVHCWVSVQYLLNAHARFSQSNPMQLIQWCVAKATRFVPLSLKLTMACVLWDSYSLRVESSRCLWLYGNGTEHSRREARVCGLKFSLGSVNWLSRLSTVAGEKHRAQHWSKCAGLVGKVLHLCWAARYCVWVKAPGLQRPWLEQVLQD